VVACALRYDRAIVAHCGDSRCYLVRHGLASQITRDHTVVRNRFAWNSFESEAAESRNRHLLSRSLGNDLFVNVEITTGRCSPAMCWCSVRTVCTGR